MERSMALIVDPDGGARARVEHVLGHRSVRAVGAAHWDEALPRFGDPAIRWVWLDLETPGLPEVSEALARVREGVGASRVVVLTGRPDSGDGATAWVGSGPTGPDDVVLKPFDDLALNLAAARCDRLGSDGSGDAPGSPSADGIVGTSRAAEDLRRRVARQSAGREPLALVGEEGSGREWAARAVHRAAGTAPEGAFVVVDCEKSGGAGEARRAIGEIGAGTVFLERVEALSSDDQGAVREAVGAAPGETRVVASFVERPLASAERGGLRTDLASMFADAVIEIEPLRTRPEDIPAFARAFLADICAMNALPAIRVGSDAMRILREYRWPGNARELRNALEHGAILALDGEITPKDLPDAIARAGEGTLRRPPGPDTEFRAAKQEVVRAFERRYLSDLLERNRGNVTAAAEQSGMLRSALQRLLRKHELRSADFRSRARGDAPH